MKRVYIVVEGQTEQEFVKEIISPHLYNYGIYDVTPILIHTSRTGRGGMVNYQHLNNTIKPLLDSSKADFITTTFIDFFRIPNTMPKYDECMALQDDLTRVKALEKAMDSNINDNRFFSYIQLHEFEALLFSNNKGFEYYFPNSALIETSKIIATYKNPEDINSSLQGAPSKRLLKIKPDYNKVLEGNLIALEIGIHEILMKCPRFSEWIDKIIEHCRN